MGTSQSNSEASELQRHLRKCSQRLVSLWYNQTCLLHNKFGTTNTTKVAGRNSRWPASVAGGFAACVRNFAPQNTARKYLCPEVTESIIKVQEKNEVKSKVTK